MFIQCRRFLPALRCKKSQRLPKKSGFDLSARLLAPASSIFLNPYRFVVLACAVLWTLVLFALAPVFAQPACDTRARVVGHLDKKYSETPISLGIANNGGLLELLTARDGATWTIIITMPNGATCLIAAGKDWLPVKRIAGEPS